MSAIFQLLVALLGRIPVSAVLAIAARAVDWMTVQRAKCRLIRSGSRLRSANGGHRRGDANDGRP